MKEVFSSYRCAKYQTRIQDHLLCKLETMIANTVFVGFSGDRLGQNISRPCMRYQTQRGSHPSEQLHSSLGK